MFQSLKLSGLGFFLGLHKVLFMLRYFSMSTVTLFFIGGVLEPSRPLVSCGQEDRCDEPRFPKPVTNTSVHTLDIWEKMRDHFEERVDQKCLNFWTQRIVIHSAATPSICSVSFCPSNLASNSTWFVQKDKVEPPLEGFYAPYLSESDQKKWKCIDGLPRLDQINNLAEIDRSIEGLELTIRSELRTLLAYFLQDPLSIMAGFTYKVNQAGERETRFWYKQT